MISKRSRACSTVAKKIRAVTLDDLLRHAQVVMGSLGTGHSEKVYHRALCAQLAEEGVPFRSEVDTPIMFKGQCVGMGRADIVLEGMVLEIKSNSKCPSQASGQLRKYIESLQDVEGKNCAGSVINFNSKTGNVEGFTYAPPEAAVVVRSRFFAGVKAKNSRR